MLSHLAASIGNCLRMSFFKCLTFTGHAISGFTSIGLYHCWYLHFCITFPGHAISGFTSMGLYHCWYLHFFITFAGFRMISFFQATDRQDPSTWTSRMLSFLPVRESMCCHVRPIGCMPIGICVSGRIVTLRYL